MQAIAFDLGETLSTYVDIPLTWQEHYRPALKRAFAASGQSLDEAAMAAACATLARYNTRIQPREHEVDSAQIFSELLGATGGDRRQEGVLAKEFFAYFQKGCRAYPETQEVLEALKQRGARIAVLTDVPYGMPKDWVWQDLRSAGIDGLIDVLITSVEVGFRKPRPEGFQRLAESLGVAANALAYVGNEKKDMEGVNAVGGLSILIDREDEQPAHGQKRRIRSLRELLN